MIMKTSPNDISNNEIMQELKKLSADVGTLKTDVGVLKADVGGLKTDMGGLTARVGGLEKFAIDAKKEFKKLSDKMDVDSEKLDAGLNKMDAGFALLEKSDQEILETMNSYATVVDDRLGKLEHGQTRMSANMVTKGYLDDKMADLRSDISHNTRRQIEKAIG